jgi:hypothetical protein
MYAFFFFAPYALACRRNLWRDLKILVPLRTAVLQLPSKSYENRMVRSAFVQLSRNRLKAHEDWYSPCQEGTHAIKSVKPSVDILEGLSTGVNMDASAPHLIHK